MYIRPIHEIVSKCRNRRCTVSHHQRENEIVGPEAVSYNKTYEIIVRDKAYEEPPNVLRTVTFTIHEVCKEIILI